MKTIEFLDPREKLVNAVVDWLLAGDRVRVTREGARSLARFLVVVPTAQSGRNLRLALAREAARRGWGGLLPPVISMANRLLVPADARIATEAEERALMAGILAGLDLSGYPHLFPRPVASRSVDWALDHAAMFLEVESILGEKALFAGDVSPGIDAERWNDLARIERLFLDACAEKGVMSSAAARKAAVAAGCREPGIEEIVLPAAVDASGAFIAWLEASDRPVRVLIHADRSDAAKFDAWGRPVAVFAAPLRPESIDAAPNAVVEADDIARFFRAVRADEALPALAVCDAAMLPELEGAFQNRFSEDELALRDTSRLPLARSSLGRLLGAILALGGGEGDYDVLSAFVRTGDVARWAAAELGTTPAETARAIGALDAVQNAHLPRTLEDTGRAAIAEAERARDPGAREDFLRLADLVGAISRGLADPFAFLAAIFSTRRLDERDPADRELVAAAEAVRTLREECSSGLVPERFRRRLFAKLLDETVFTLEPTAANVLAVTGWLEVPWCREDEIAFAGFNEGCVPGNIVGHPFVPDRLRAELGLSTNASREARDSFILAEAVACRAPGAVSVHLHQIAADRNVMKPSRILFNGISDVELPRLAKRLYAVVKGGEGAPAKNLPEAWRLRLPMPPKGCVPRESVSPTAIDSYLGCPFTFYLDELFGEHPDDRDRELDAPAFGNLCHGALEAFAKSECVDSADAGEIAAFLAAEVRRRLADFGDPLPAVIELQGEAAVARLGWFAARQAERRAAGWRIVAAELKLSCRLGSCPTVIRGKLDRVDRHERTGELAIIDYKTWRKARDDRRESVQLPIYRDMLLASGRFDAAAAREAKAMYCILAERAEDTRFDEEGACNSGHQSEADAKTIAALGNIARGVFYPPASLGEDAAWRKKYASLFPDTPEAGIAPEWIADQLERREESR